MIAGQATRAQLKIEGTVQGVGFRPFVFRVARELGLAGWIMNGTEGVLIEAEGTADAVDRLLDRLRTGCPPGVNIERMTLCAIPAIGDAAFTIQPSHEAGTKQLAMSPDLATCADCLVELFDPTDRRFHYPWLSCAQCGPRMSMVTSIPYDRANTTMSRFALCEDCRVEYDTPDNRRFHAESLACPACGPTVALWGHDGQVLAEGEEALQRTCRIIRDGGIVAVKGIGGFHLWVDATSEEAVQLLRARKRRAHKPFAVMFPTLETIRMSCDLSPGEAEWLTSPAAPVVILQRGEQTSLAEGIAPGNRTVGAMCDVGVGQECGWKEQEQLLVAMLAKRIHSPITTSMGRLFDAVASMLGLCQVATFEGQAAMALEQAAMQASASVQSRDETYSIALNSDESGSQRWVADWRPMIERIVDDLSRGTERSLIAYRFHRALAELIGQMAERGGLRQVVLTGGCFQNALLVDLARERLESAGFVALTHRQVPANDGGLALGQAVIAATLGTERVGLFTGLTNNEGRKLCV
ncbi:MAG: hypothetical protein HP494_03695 [Nitrospira sp.]|nr:hypothetical protein [Nitrospira sp.]